MPTGQLVTLSNDVEIRITPKQRAFCHAYMGGESMNPAAAVEEAGYETTSAQAMGLELLKQANIQQYIRELSQDLDFPREMLPSTLADKVKAIALCDPRKAFRRDEDGNIVRIPVIEMPPEVAACIKSMTEIRIKQGDQWVQGFKYEFYDKLKAAELLGRWLGMENRKDPLLTDLEPQPEWSGLIVEGLPAERQEDGDVTSDEQQREAARQVRALSTFEESDQVVEVAGRETS